MPKPIDATTKTLLRAGPDAWVALAGVAVDGPITALDTDVSTVTAAVDGVYRIDGPESWLIHFEFQSSADSTLPRRLWRYNILLDDRHGMPVLSVAVLLRPKADAPSLLGVHERRLPQGSICHTFRYAVVRVWEIPVQRLLAGGLSTLPLALISDLGQTLIEDVATQIQRRIQTEAPLDLAADYWAATSLLAALRLGPDVGKRLLGGGFGMDLLKDSWVVDWLREELGPELKAEVTAEARAEGEAAGRAKEARAILMTWGAKRLGAPDQATRAAIESITDIARLEALLERLPDVASWHELLQSPTEPVSGA